VIYAFVSLMTPSERIEEIARDLKLRDGRLFHFEAMLYATIQFLDEEAEAKEKAEYKEALKNGL
jgi:hypothetical protein